MAPLPSSLRENPLSQNTHHIPLRNETTSAPFLDSGPNHSYATHSALGGGALIAAAGVATYWLKNKFISKAPNQKDVDPSYDMETAEN
jgi:hypothetical protein